MLALRSGLRTGRKLHERESASRRTKGAAWRSSGNDFVAALAATRGLSAR
jgi:hypothetical protein